MPMRYGEEVQEGSSIWSLESDSRHHFGLVHRTSAKRAKSRSKLTIVASFSIAIPARCASVVKLPAVPAARSSLPSISACRSPGWSICEFGTSIQWLITRIESSTDSGLGKIPPRVDRRRNASSDTQANPTPRGEAYPVFSAVRAAVCCSVAELAAYSNTLTSGRINGRAVVGELIPHPQAQPPGRRRL